MTIETKGVSKSASEDLTGQREFSTRLVLELARKPGNLLVSPYSAWNLLSLLQPGAKGATRELLDRVPGVKEGGVLETWSDPLEELMVEEKPRVFHTLDLQGPRESYPDSFFIKKRQFDLIVANAVWLQKGYQLRPEYVSQVEDRFKARVEELDFAGRPAAACDTINKWADEETRGKISRVLSPSEIRLLTRLILNNATYFKDDWLLPFAREDTCPEPFHRLEGPKIEVPTMHKTAPHPYFEAPGIQAVKMPYCHSDLSMTVVLPRHIRRFEASLSPQEFDRLFELEGRLERVQLALPRYRFTTDLNLIGPLGALGLGPLFDESADLSGLSPEPGVYVDFVKQNTFIRIDEKGTEAAAVTTGGLCETESGSRPPEPKQMIVDRPYWFFIRDERSGTMLFAGRVEDPS